MIFRKLLDLLSRKPEKRPRMFDLSDHDVRGLSELRSLPEFEIYLSCLDRQSTLYGEAMLSSTDSNRLHEMRGYVLGMRMAGMLVDEILHAEKERVLTNERSRSDRPDPRKFATINTPGWGS